MHSVPFYSQYDDSVPEEWRERACGIICLQMALEGRSSSSFTAHDLIKEATSIEVYDANKGWPHHVLVSIAHNHGVPAYQEEFKSRDSLAEEQLARYGIKKLKEEVTRGRMIIVSVAKGFKPEGSLHMVLLTGLGSNGFEYNDPAGQSPSSGANQVITEEEFFKHWRRLCIIVG